MIENPRRSLAFRGAVLGGVIGYFGDGLRTLLHHHAGKQYVRFLRSTRRPIGLGVFAVIRLIVGRRRK